MRNLIPGTWLAYVLFLIPASVALASNANSRSPRSSSFGPLFEKVPYGGSLSQRSVDIAPVSNEDAYSNEAILEVLGEAVVVSLRLENVHVIPSTEFFLMSFVVVDGKPTFEGVVPFGGYWWWSQSLS